MKQIKQIAGKALAGLFLIYVVVVCLGPLIWVFFQAFKTNKEILISAFALPKAFRLDGFRVALETAPILLYFRNSVVISVVNTGITVVAVSMAAYMTARFQFRGKRFFTLMLSSSLLIPVSSLLMPIYLLLTKMGMIDTMRGLILIYAALGLPTSLFILQSTFQGIPRELEEAAYIDGAGVFYTFFTIILPIAKPGVATAATLHFITSWNEFMFALVMTKSASVRTLPLALNYFTSQFSFNYTAMFAAIVLSILPSILVFICLQEQITASMVSGSLKG